MAAQLELDLGVSRPTLASPRARVRGGLNALLLWTPFWVPLAFLGQLVVLGLRPARAEAERLDRAEFEVRARVQDLERERDELEAEARMLSDEVYQERVRRSLLDPAAPPLTLERARQAEKP